MAEQAKQIQLKLYLEGIEFPINSIKLEQNRNKEPFAFIRVPSNKDIINLKEKTLTHVFYKDSNTDGRWLLIFEGEFAGFSYIRSQNSNEVVLNCANIENRWKMTKKNSTYLHNYGGKQDMFATVSFSSVRQEDRLRSERKYNKEFVDKLDFELDEFKQNKQAVKESEAGKKTEIFLNLFASKFSNTVINKLKEYKGDLSNLVKIFATGFAQSDLSYSIPHFVYRLKDRIFGTENEAVKSVLETTEVQSLLKNNIKGLPGSTSLHAFIKRILELVNYDFLIDSAPTYNQSSKSPQNFFTIPFPKLMTPIAPNTFFPNDVMNLNFNRNFMKEPTRIVSAEKPNLGKNPDRLLFVNQDFVVSPSHELEYGENGIQLGLTQKERLGGVRGIVKHDNFAATKAEKETEDSDDKLLDLRLRYTDMKYQDLLLDSRTCTFNTTFSPYRLVGFPGAFINTEGPSIVGTITSITSEISADGMSSSSVKMDDPRTINLSPDYIPENWDEIFSDYSDEELKDMYPFEDVENYKKDEGKKRWYDYYVFNLKITETFSFLPNWYDKEAFFPDKIGSKLYKKLVFGLEEGEESSFEDKEDSEFFPSNLDGSILRNVDTESFEPKFADMGVDVENTEYILEGMTSLLNRYQLNKDFKKDFIKRNIITEKRFWKFLLDKDYPKNNENVRSIRQPVPKERGQILTAYENSDNEASAPFIKERQEVVELVKKALDYKGIFVGGNNVTVN